MGVCCVCACLIAPVSRSCCLRTIQPVGATLRSLNQGIYFHDPAAGKRSILSGWVDSDLASDVDSRNSVTGYLLSLDGGPISWKAARQGGVTLSSSKAEFVAASHAGKEVLYLRALLKGFACKQMRPTELWEDNASCILMSENPINHERSRRVDVRVHFTCCGTWCGTVL